jgi:hypothetical protein
LRKAVQANFNDPSWHVNSAHLSEIFHPWNHDVVTRYMTHSFARVQEQLGKDVATSKPTFPT